MGFPPMASAAVESFQPDEISAAVLADPTSRKVCHERPFRDPGDWAREGSVG